MTQYRLLERNVDTIKDTDEFWDELKGQWSVIPSHLIGRPFVGSIPYRRAIPEPEPVIDPGEGYRLLKLGEEMVDGDEYLFNDKWSPVPCLPAKYSNSTAIVRRRCTKKVVLKEYLVRFAGEYTIEWSSKTPDVKSYTATGQEREIEVPV